MTWAVRGVKDSHAPPRTQCHGSVQDGEGEASVYMQPHNVSSFQGFGEIRPSFGVPAHATALGRKPV